MKKFSAFLLCAALAVCPAFAKKTSPPPGLSPVNLGSAASFAVFGASGVTSTGNTVITGYLGVYPIAGTAVTGFFSENAGGPGIVIGTIQDNDTALETTAAKHAFASLGIAIADAAGRPCTPCTLENAADLGGLTITPGLYESGTTLALTGTLVLSGKGVYIFQIGSALTVNDGAEIILANGATAADVFWQVGTLAALGTGVAFEGTILAGAGVTMGSSTTLVGRALSQTDVTFIDDTVTLPPSPKK